MSEKELSAEEKEKIKQLMREQRELMYYVIEEILEGLPDGDAVLRRALERWLAS